MALCVPELNLSILLTDGGAAASREDGPTQLENGGGRGRTGRCRVPRLLATRNRAHATAWLHSTGEDFRTSLLVVWD